MTAITGPSGSGKSTLLRVCNGLLHATEGTVRLDGADIAGIEPSALRRRVGLVAQQPVMLAGTVAENVVYGHPGADVPAALRMAGLDGEFAQRDADRLSGGEQVRVAIARAWVCDPRVLLLDESTAPLDRDTATRLGQTLRRLADDGLAVALATHDLAFAEKVCDRRVSIGGPA